jgi:ferric-dicitrate binding protein FerR (iron transport regulator)
VNSAAPGAGGRPTSDQGFAAATDTGDIRRPLSNTAMPDSVTAAMDPITTERRQFLRRSALAAGAGLLLLAARPLKAQTATQEPAPQYGRRRRRGLGDVLWIGGALAALFGGIVVLGKRARRKDQQKAELAARLAACREKSRSL